MKLRGLLFSLGFVFLSFPGNPPHPNLKIHLQFRTPTMSLIFDSIREREELLEARLLRWTKMRTTRTWTWLRVRTSI